MVKKYIYGIILFTIFLSFAIIPLAGKEQGTITISGLVRTPLNLNSKDLHQFRPTTVRMNAITSSGDFRGVFTCTGVSLKELLLFAKAGKEPGKYSKPIDLAIAVTGKDGSRTVLSWGEVMYSQPGQYLVTTAMEPVMPMKQCTHCHKDNKYKQRYSILTRDIITPGLVVPADRWYDRSIEGIQTIQVIDPGEDTNKGAVRDKKLYSRSFTISGSSLKPVTVTGIKGLQRHTISAVQVGDGRGYHGCHTFEGVSLADLLKKHEIPLKKGSSLIIAAPDGYHSLLSAGELLYGNNSDRIIVADMMNGKTIKKDGKFVIVMPDDLSADRWVKSVSEIRIIDQPTTGKLYIIGVGCGDTSLISLQAISHMGVAHAFVCTSDIANRFSDYMAGKTVLFDPLESMLHYYMKTHPGISKEDAVKAVKKIRYDGIASIKKLIEEGKDVAFLDYGDPTIYGSWTYWLPEHFDKNQVEVIPGISAFNAGNAMLAKNIAARGSAVITVPDGLRSNEKMLQAIASNGDTLVIFVGLKEMEDMAPLLQKYYGKDAPVAIAYRAGYSQDQKLIHTSLKDVVKLINQNREKFLGIIYLGDVLKAKQVRPEKTGKNPL